MPFDGAPSGWDWFAADNAAPTDADELELCRAFAHCFAGAAGKSVLEHLRRVILERRLAPHASDAELRHLEGQRYAVAYIAALVERGSA
jgi:hypothetical protein